MFSESMHDFGAIREADGPVSHTFVFTNVSAAPVILGRVQSSCGCTTVRYTREPVMPGDKGTVEVTFDPAGFKGRVTRSVTVAFNGGRTRSLTIRADVVEKPRPAEEQYPFTLASGVRAERLHVPFGYIANGSTASMVVALVNTTKREVAIVVDEVTGGGRLIAIAPAQILAGGQSSVTLTWDLRGGEPLYGVVSEMVYLSIDGRRCELPITASAIVTDDFGKQDAAAHPECVITPAFHNFGEVKAGQTASCEIIISNPGSAPLIVRSVTPRGGAGTSLREGDMILPGGRTIYNVWLETSGGHGIKTGGITIIVNEPEHPMREIRLAAEVIDN